MIIATTFYKKIFVILALSVLLLATNTFGQDLEIYVSDAANFSNPPWKILKFDENGENPEVFIDTVLAWPQDIVFPVSYTHLRAHETVLDLVCRLLLEKKKTISSLLIRVRRHQHRQIF